MTPAERWPELTDERTSGEAVEDQALAWHLRLRDADADEWQEFTTWLAQDPAHNDAYEAVALRDAQLDAVLAQASFPEPATQAPSDVPGGPTVGPNRMRWLALAASVALVVFLSVRFLAPGADLYAIETAPGKTRTIALADGGTIVVNGGSRILLDRKDERTADLVRGEAHFTVVHNAADPFVVTIGESRLVDIGTVFNVVRYGEDLRVAVAEGAVRYEGQESVELAAGQAMHRMADGRIEVVRQQVKAVGGWVGGTLVYDRAPLAEIAADLTRTTGLAIDLAPGLEQRRFSGVIQTRGDTAALRDRVAAVLELTVDTNETGWTIRP
jgi:transmembrane sensor